MIYGIGIDLCKIQRMEKSLESPAFRSRVFSAREWSALDGLSVHKQAESAAANFAAKEAFLKAAGVGLGGFPLTSIQFLRLESGAPVLEPFGSVKRFLDSHGLVAHVTMTHEDGLAQAMVILEKISAQ